MFSELQKFGLSGELLVYDRLVELGYHPVLCSDFTARYDLLISGCCLVEVKTARLTRRWNGRRYYWRWQFDISRLLDQDYLIVLVCEVAGQGAYFFVCPSWVFWGRSHIQITSHPERYRGRLAEYLDNWSVIGSVVSRCLHPGLQLRLF